MVGLLPITGRAPRKNLNGGAYVYPAPIEKVTVP